ncbi:uncharacterized [Tachysurus ichikawai]
MKTSYTLNPALFCLNTAAIRSDSPHKHAQVPPLTACLGSHSPSYGYRRGIQETVRLHTRTLSRRCHCDSPGARCGRSGSQS